MKYGAIITENGKEVARFYSDDSQELEVMILTETRRITAQQVRANLFTEVRVCYV